MIYFKKILFTLLLATIFVGCGSDSDSTANETPTQDEQITPDGTPTEEPVQTPPETSSDEELIFPSVYLEMPKSDPCQDGQFYRLKTKECLAIKKPSSGFEGWGFQGFVPAENNYTISTLTEKELKDVIANLPAEGGRIIIPEGTIEIVDGITIPGNVILEGAGAGKTILSNTSSDADNFTSVVELDGENIIVRGMTIEGNGESLNGIDGHKSRGNILIEFIEARNFKLDQGSGIAFIRKSPLYNSNITIRYNNVYNGLHGIGVKMRTGAEMLIYSNQAFNNTNYGLDVSITQYVEIAGNYLHNNEEGGAKSPRSNGIIYHHNDINFNKVVGIAYMGRLDSATITLEENDLSNNEGPAFNASSAYFYKLTLKNNIVTNSVDQNGYTIGAYGVRLIWVSGDHGDIWYNEAAGYRVVNTDEVE